MARIEAVPIGSASDYEIGRQEMEVRFHDATVGRLACRYPPDRESPGSIAERKLRDASQGLVDADRILGLVLNLEDEPNLGRLSEALSGRQLR